MISKVRKGDIVVVWKLDRLGRSLQDLIDLVSGFKEQDVEFISIQDSINTATATGRFTFNIFASLAEFQREIISERTKAGLTAARSRGQVVPLTVTDVHGNINSATTSVNINFLLSSSIPDIYAMNPSTDDKKTIYLGYGRRLRLALML